MPNATAWGATASWPRCATFAEGADADRPREGDGVERRGREAATTQAGAEARARSPRRTRRRTGAAQGGEGRVRRFRAQPSGRVHRVDRRGQARGHARQAHRTGDRMDGRGQAPQLEVRAESNRMNRAWMLPWLLAVALPAPAWAGCHAQSGARVV